MQLDSALRCLTSSKIYSGLIPDGRHLVSRARDEASSWRTSYKSPIPNSSLAFRIGSYVQAYTLYSSVRPFGVTSIVAGMDPEVESLVDAQVGSGPKSGGGKPKGTKIGGPGLYMIEPSGLYWVSRLVTLSPTLIHPSIHTYIPGVLWSGYRQRSPGSQSRTGEVGSIGGEPHT